MSTLLPKDSFGSFSERPPIIEQLRAESRGLPFRPAKRQQQPGPSRPSPEDVHRLFTIENGNRWLELARREPEAKMLLGELWHQGELCMLFADTNIGKSVLAVQIGESIARGQGITPFACQAPPARVLYIDFELSAAQFGLRYSKGDEDHQFSDNFFRAQYNFIPDPPSNVNENELLVAAIEYKINQCKASVLIIDNITCLRGGTENSAVALALMKSLKALKTEHNLSILVLAHTPKRRNATQPISADDLHGSKLLINFADSAFAIGKSTIDNDLCYLKQIKQRNTRQRYGHDNVCLCRIQKPGTFLHLAFEGNSAERLHLLNRTTADRQQLANKIAALSATGLSQRDIARQLNIGLATVNRLIRCADVQMRGCANEKECADALMTNDVMINDQNGYADVQMREYADEGFTEMQMPENTGAESIGTNSFPVEGIVQGIPIGSNCPAKNNVAEKSAGSCDSLPWEGLGRGSRTMHNELCMADIPLPATSHAGTPPHGGSCHLPGYYATEENLTINAPFPPTPIDDIQMVTPPAHLKPAWDRKISTIDELLTPELLDHILKTTAREIPSGEMR